jgi:alpha-tubulin suppressor-like RCC1 family protein
MTFPTYVAQLQSGTISQIALQRLSGCALFSNSTIQCWGKNTQGQLGNNSTTDSSIPVSVVNLQSGTISQIASGTSHSCALFANSTVQCWGGNASGQLGNNSSTDSSVPVSVVGLQFGTISQIALGNASSCALFSNSTVQCWVIIVMVSSGMGQRRVALFL